jgi:hypothetical protein
MPPVLDRTREPRAYPARPQRSAGVWALLFRRAFLTFAAAGVAGTALELAMSRHWGSLVMFIPWVVLAALTAGIAVAVFRPSPRALRAVRWLAVVVAATAVFGVVRHVLANYDAGPLDADYETRWATMSALARWWAALIQSVGPSPTVAPLILALSAACLWLGTLPTELPVIVKVLVINRKNGNRPAPGPGPH